MDLNNTSSIKLRYVMLVEWKTNWVCRPVVCYMVRKVQFSGYIWTGESYCFNVMTMYLSFLSHLSCMNSKTFQLENNSKHPLLLTYCLW